MLNSDSTNEYVYTGKIKEYEQVLVEFFKKLGDLKNQSIKISIINGYLAIHKNLTQRQLKKLTGFSSGSISKYLNIMIKFGTIKRFRRNGSNEYIYSLTKPLPQIYASTSELSIDLIEPIVNEISISLNKLEDFQNLEGYGILKTRLTDLQNTFESFSKIKELLFN